MAERQNQPGYIDLSTAVAQTESEKIGNFNQQLNGV